MRLNCQKAEIAEAATRKALINCRTLWTHRTGREGLASTHDRSGDIGSRARDIRAIFSLNIERGQRRIDPAPAYPTLKEAQ